ncbi:helix-turn-helix transcriptional regulator [Rubellimicrobium arenae]|uniref:helix-turn-helix transcriptional regulator n=1 Tax=Rubellimicrobium arenae TaxID=2817372 RepID=UPI001B302673|nr:helix-turn-helix transcriptional regulator [Rubellimicrobium arenae]
MSTLEQYLAENGIKQAAFAASISISRGALADLLTGRRTPSLALAKRISDATSGGVPMEIWLRDQHTSAHANAACCEQDHLPEKTVGAA